VVAPAHSPMNKLIAAGSRPTARPTIFLARPPSRGRARQRSRHLPRPLANCCPRPRALGWPQTGRRTGRQRRRRETRRRCSRSSRAHPVSSSTPRGRRLPVRRQTYPAAITSPPPTGSIGITPVICRTTMPIPASSTMMYGMKFVPAALSEATNTAGMLAQCAGPLSRLVAGARCLVHPLEPERSPKPAGLLWGHKRTQAPQPTEAAYESRKGPRGCSVVEAG
jgi:hypothetical protein